MQFLKQSTAVKVTIGPVVDVTDGYTAETGLDLSTSDSAEVIKHNTATTTDISGATLTAITGADGLYALDLTTSYTDTLGLLSVYVEDVSLCRPVRQDFMVVPENVYDSLFSTDKLQVDVTQFNGNAASGLLSGTTALNADVTMISGDSTAADNLEASAEGIVASTCASGSSTTLIKTNLTETTNDHYNGRTIVFTSGALSGLAASISDYNGASKDITVAAVTEAPSNGDTFVIV